MKLKRPIKARREGEAELPLPPLIQYNTDNKRNPLAIGIGLVILFLIGSGILLGIFIFYDKYFGELEYVPDYHTLRDNLTMPDGRTHWDNNNQTDMLVAAAILEEGMNRQIAERNQSNMSIEEFLDQVKPRVIMAGPTYVGGISD